MLNVINSNINLVVEEERFYELPANVSAKAYPKERVLSEDLEMMRNVSVDSIEEMELEINDVRCVQCSNKSVISIVLPKVPLGMFIIIS